MVYFHNSNDALERWIMAQEVAVAAESLSPLARDLLLEKMGGIIRRAACYVHSTHRSGGVLSVDDLAQEGWILARQIVDGWCPVRGRTMTLERWLLVRLTNALVDHVRTACKTRSKLKQYFVSDKALDNGQTERQKRRWREGVEAAEGGMDFHAAMALLSSRHRELIDMRFVQRKKLDDMAEHFGVSGVIVRQRLALAVEAFRSHFR